MFDRLRPQLLASSSPSGHMRVLQNDRYRWLESNADVVHSAMDRHDATALILPYTRWMMWPLLLSSIPRSALCLGLGAGSLTRFLGQICAVTSVEVDAQIAAWAHQYFDLPATATLHVEDARRYLSTVAPESFDWLVCDLFDTQKVPDWVANLSFLDACLATLSAHGSFVLNTSVYDEARVERLVLAIQEAASGPTITLPVPETANLVVAAFARPILPVARVTLCERAEMLEASWSMPFTQMANALYNRYGSRGVVRL